MFGLTADEFISLAASRNFPIDLGDPDLSAQDKA